jgi:hypothetical protein
MAQLNMAYIKSFISNVKSQNFKNLIFELFKIFIMSFTLGVLLIFLLEHKIEISTTLFQTECYTKGCVFNFRTDSECSIQCSYDNTESFFGNFVSGTKRKNEILNEIFVEDVFEAYQNGWPVLYRHGEEINNTKDFTTTHIYKYFTFKHPMSCCDAYDYRNRFFMYLNGLKADINYVLFSSLVIFCFILFFRRYNFKIRINFN